MSNERLKGWKKQETAFNYAEEREFGPGLRAGGLYADLGVAKATGGQFHAHVIKVNPEKHDHDGTTGMHRHDYDFQFNYVLKGSIDFVIEGHEGTLTFKEGDSYLLPYKILHDETRVSDDYEVLEIYAPARSGTQQIVQGAGGGEVSEDWDERQSKMSY